MDREQARQEIRRQVKCDAYLEKSKDGLYCCPFCGSGHNGNSNTGAVKYYPKTNTICCFAGCAEGSKKGKKYDVIDLFRQKYGTDYNTALTSLATEIGITIDPYRPEGTTYRKKRVEASNSPEDAKPDKNMREAENAPKNDAGELSFIGTDYTAYYAACRKRLSDPAAAAYLQKRGISIETAAAYWLGYDPEADPASAPGAMEGERKSHPCPRIIIPTSRTHYVGRRIDGVDAFAKINAKESTPAIFNANALYAQDVQEIYVTEGAFDALSVLEAGYTAIALNSAGNFSVLLDMLTKRRTQATLILCPDSDADPETAARVREQFQALADGLQRLNISHVIADINGACKDANEHLTTDKTEFCDALEAARRQGGPKPDNVEYYIKHVMRADIARFKSDIKTGFENLDEKSGGLYAGLYVVAAISSLGKTTFCHQIADQIAAAGHDVLYFSLEQSRFEMVSKSIARRTAQMDRYNAATSLAIRRGRTNSFIEAATQEYVNDVKDRLSVIEGNFSCNISFIGDYIRQYIRKNEGRQPVVFVDYLQILQPEEDDRGRRQTTKETVDSTVTELKRISRELNLIVIVISSVNRANYLTPIDFESLKESGGIEYTADVVYGLQLECVNSPIFDKANNTKERREAVNEAKAAIPRKVELRCLKNRYGKLFDCFFDYYPINDLFEVREDRTNTAPKAGRRI